MLCLSISSLFKQDQSCTTNSSNPITKTEFGKLVAVKLKVETTPLAKIKLLESRYPMNG